MTRPELFRESARTIARGEHLRRMSPVLLERSISALEESRRLMEEIGTAELCGEKDAP